MLSEPLGNWLRTPPSHRNQKNLSSLCVGVGAEFTHPSNFEWSRPFQCRTLKAHFPWSFLSWQIWGWDNLAISINIMQQFMFSPAMLQSGLSPGSLGHWSTPQMTAVNSCKSTSSGVQEDLPPQILHVCSQAWYSAPSARQTHTSSQRNHTLHLSSEAAAGPGIFFCMKPASSDLEASFVT